MQSKSLNFVQFNLQITNTSAVTTDCINNKTNNNTLS